MQYQTLKAISEASGVNYHTLRNRLIGASNIRTERAGSVILIHKDDVSKLTGTPPTLKTHGRTKTPLYSRWTSLLHGHRDEVDERWHTFENFLEDMGEPQTRRHRLRRLDTDQPWSADNCKWTRK